MHGRAAHRCSLLLAFAVVAFATMLPAAASAHEAHEEDGVTHVDTPDDLRETDIQATVADAWLSPEGSMTLAAAPPLTWCGQARTTDDTADAAYPASTAQFKIIYAYPSDRPNRFAQWANAMQADASLLESYVSLQPGSSRAPRLDMGTSCGPQYLDIQTVALPAARSYYVDNLGAVKNYVATVVNPAPGGPRNYFIFSDTLGSGLFANAFVIGDTRPGSDNANNAGAMYASMWIPDGTVPPSGNSYWPAGMLHEMTHSMGAVQGPAPHSTEFFHCWDGSDLMCYSDGSPKGNALYTRTVCGSGGYMGSFYTLQETMDCNQDDYFNPAPPSGSYLDLNWNVYNSVFMGDCSALQTCATTAAPVNTGAPVVTRSGATLTASDGTWTGATSFTYAWQRCAGGACRIVYPSPSSTYQVTSADSGFTLRVVVTATNTGGGYAYAYSAETDPIPPAPVNTAAPQVSGSATVGATLTTTGGGWTGSPALAYTWERCRGASCAPIAGATASAYTVQSADGNYALRAVVYATNDGGQVSAPSVQTATVPAPPETITAPQISGSPAVGSTLSASTGTWVAAVSYAYQWQRNVGSGWSDVAGATNPAYTVVSADVGATIRVQVAATNALGSTTAASAATATVTLSESGYQAAVSASSPVAWYRFDDAGGSLTVRNYGSAGTAMNLTRTGNVALSIAGPLANSRAAAFGAATDYLRQSTAGTTIAGTFTVELMMRSTSGAPLSTRQSSDLGYEWQCSTLAGNCGQVVGTGASWLTTNGSFSTTALNGVGWHHVASVVTPTGYTAYVDGVASGSGTWSGTPVFVNATHVLTLGGSFNGGAALQEKFSGQMDEVAVYGSALSAGTIAAHAAAAGFSVGPPPVNTAAPAITGATSAGATLTADPGTWTGASAYAYQWQRNAGGGWADIAGATSTTYALTSGDVGATIRVQVTAGPTTAASAATSAITAVAPANTAAPAVSGTPASGSTLTASAGTWTGAPSYAYQWQRNGGAGWSDIAGATGSSYVLVSADVGATVRVQVTATNSAGSATASSTATTAIGAVAVTEAGYQAAVSASSPVAWYRFDDVGGAQTVRNYGSAGTAMDLTRTGNVALSIAGAIPGSKAAAFGAATDYLRQSTAGTTIAGTFTVELMMRSTSGAPLSTRQSSDLGYEWQCSTLAGNCGQVVGTGASWLTTNGSFSTTALNGVGWHHVASVVTPTGYTTYVDGVASGSGTWSGTPVFVNATHVLTLGGSFNGGAALQEKFSGQMDEFAVYNAALSASTIAAHATAGGFAGGAPAVNTAAPTVSGTTTAGSTLTASPGTWTGASSFAYRWQRNAGAGWVDIAGATSATYTLAAADVGATIRVQVSAGATTAASAATATVTAVAPSNTAVPTVTGSATAGSTLTASAGTWTGAPAYAYQWQRNTGAGWADIAGATSATYVLVSADIGATVRVQVTGTNPAGSSTASSAPTAAIGAVAVTEAGYQAAVAASAPVAWYRFDDIGGSLTVRNYGSAGTAMDLTRTGNVALSIAGAIPGSKAAAFGAATDYLRQSTAGTSITGTFTVEMMRYQTSATGAPLSTRQASDFGYEWQCAIVAGNCGQVVGTGAGWLTTTGSFATSALTATWHHVATVVTPAGYTTYVDGVQTATGSWSGTPVFVNSTHVLTLGGSFNGGAALQEKFSGLMDEVAVYNTALSASTIAAHASAGGF